MCHNQEVKYKQAGQHSDSTLHFKRETNIATSDLSQELSQILRDSMFVDNCKN